MSLLPSKLGYCLADNASVAVRLWTKASVAPKAKIMKKLFAANVGGFLSTTNKTNLTVALFSPRFKCLGVKTSGTDI